jgi:ATP-dependent Lon protease
VPNRSHKLHSEGQPQPAGFEERTLTVFFNDRLVHAQLLLPIGPTTDDLVDKRREVAAEAARTFDARAEEQRYADEERRKAAAFASLNAKENGEAPLPNPPRNSFKKNGKLDVLVERDRLLEKQQIDQDAQGSKPGVEVYHWDEPLKLIKDADVKSPDRDWRERDQQLYERLAKMGSFRQLGGAQTELEDMTIDLGILRKQQPHFSEVVDLILGQVRLAEVKGTPLHLPPILLAGPPGVGKTHFTFELARALERPLHRHSLDVSHTGSSLMGSARNWGNTHIGLVFDMVCLNNRADPLILLDELDKARRSHNADPIAPLHSLLEPLTASKVTDISAGIEFDASHIFWVSTANNLYQIPAPIRSRFRVFNIAMPSAEQAITLAQAVGMSVHRRMNEQSNPQKNPEAGTPEPIFTAPSPRLINLLAHLTPREQIQAWEHAYSTALANGRRQVAREDLPADVLLDDGDPTKPGQHLH